MIVITAATLDGAVIFEPTVFSIVRLPAASYVNVMSTPSLVITSTSRPRESYLYVFDPAVELPCATVSATYAIASRHRLKVIH